MKRLIRKVKKELNNIDELMKYSDIYLPIREEIENTQHKKTFEEI